MWPDVPDSQGTLALNLPGFKLQKLKLQIGVWRSEGCMQVHKPTLLLDTFQYISQIKISKSDLKIHFTCFLQGCERAGVCPSISGHRWPVYCRSLNTYQRITLSFRNLESWFLFCKTCWKKQDQRSQKAQWSKMSSSTKRCEVLCKRQAFDFIG